MIGRRWRAPLGLLLGVNSALGPNAAFAAVTSVAIAASVALSTSLEMSSRAVQRIADRTADALAGDAQLEVVGGRLGIPEALAGEIAAVPGVARATGTLAATLTVDAAELPLHVLGIDLLAESARRDFAAERGGVEVRDPLELLARADAVVVSREVAARAGVGFGDSLRVHGALGPRELHVEGLLAERGVARAFGGQVAVMDVYALQALVGREGLLDRVDVVPAPGADLDALRAEIARRVAGAGTVRRPGLRRSALDQTLAALRTAVLAIAALGSLVAGLLAYAATSSAVERRLREFAVLRATGFAARDVARLVAGDAAALALTGTALGLAAGRALAAAFLPTLSQVSEYFAAGSARADDVSVSAATLALAAAVGGACALAGAVGPARQATRRWALEAAGAAAGAPRTHGRPWFLVLAPALAAAALWTGLPARARLVLVLVLGALAAGSLTAPALALLARARPGLSRAIPGVGHLLGTGLAVRPRGTALAVAAIACLVAFVDAALVVSASFRATLLRALASRYPEAIHVSAAPVFDQGRTDVIDPALLAAIRGAPGVADLSEEFASTILFRGEEVELLALQADAALAHRHFARAAEREAFAALARGEVAVSHAFARRFGVAPGDSIALDTPAGARSFRVAGELDGMAGPSGIVYLDLGVFDAHWKRPGSVAALLFPAGDPARALAAVRRVARGGQPLFFTDNRELLAQAETFAARFDALLFALASLALVLGGAAIANLLVGIVTARRRELVLLRTAGASPGQLAAVVLGDAALVAAGAVAAGAALGVALSVPMLEVLGNEFGLWVEARFAPPRLALLFALLAAAVLASAAYPARLASRSATLDVSSFG